MENRIFPADDHVATIREDRVRREGVVQGGIGLDELPASDITASRSTVQATAAHVLVRSLVHGAIGVDAVRALTVGGGDDDVADSSPRG